MWAVARGLAGAGQQRLAFGGLQKDMWDLELGFCLVGAFLWLQLQD